MTSTPSRDTILFLCVANSARSQMAEAIGRSLAPEGIEVCSAGSEPATVNPFALQALQEIGLDASMHRSKGVDEIPQDRVRFAITLCAEEVCPVFFAGEAEGDVTRLHWPHEDPAAVEGSDAEVLASFARVRDQLRERLAAFYADPAFFPPAG